MQTRENARRVELERKIVRHIVRELRSAGFQPTQVWDGGEYVPATTEAQVMNAVFAVDDATVHFDGGRGDNEHSHGVYFVLGNGIDVYARQARRVLRAVSQ